MKRHYLLLLAMLFSIGFAACASESSEQEAGEEETEQADSDAADHSSSGLTLSTWEGHSAKATPSNEGKWVATLTFGEELDLLNESAMDEQSGKEYEKVRLLDGKEGWVRADFIAKDAALAAVVEETQIYKRPGVSNITDEALMSGTIIVVRSHKDEFSEFIARNDAKSKRQQGWVMGERAITTDENDVAAAVLYNKAMAEKSPEKRREKLKQVVHNYPNSVFAKTAQNALDATDAAQDIAEDELMITGDHVNVRSSPSVTEDNKIFQLNTGDRCKIMERGDMEEIGGKLDYWYKINAEGRSGWVFGTFTTKAM